MTTEELKIIITAETSKFKSAMKGTEAELQKISGTGGKLGSKLSGLGGKIGGALKAGAVAGTVAFGAMAVKIGKDALNAYSDYEQLSGGVEKLFGSASGAVIKNAQNAYKTAGMDANTYMETVTSFSAGLISSLGGDTAKASKIADQSIRDMSDNANVFGTDIQSIQNAYQGFAKGNFTMLDNLKLGYGGTKSEMERLLADASKISGVDYNIDNVADLYEAIHVVQQEMGITGTTAKEASKTIEGSVNSMKGAWQNWLTGLGDSKADMGELTNNLLSSVKTVIKNVVPRIGQITKGVVSAVVSVGAQIGAKIPSIVSDIGNYIQQNGPTLIEKVKALVPQIITAVKGALSSAVATFGDIPIAGPILKMWNGVFPHLVSSIQKIIPIIKTLLQGIIGFLKPVIPAIISAVDGIYSAIAPIVVSIWSFISEWLGKLSAFYQAHQTEIQTVFSAIGQIVAFLIGTVGKRIQTIITIVGVVWNFLKPILSLVGSALLTVAGVIIRALARILPWVLKVMKFFNNFGTNINTVCQKVKAFVVGMVSSVVGKFSSLVSSVAGKVKAFASKVKSGFTSAKTKAVSVVGSLYTNVTSKIGSLVSTVGSKISGITSKITSPFSKAKDKIGGIIDGIKGKFPFSLGHIIDFSVPSISLNTASKSVLGKTITYPTGFDVSWHAKGGILNSATLIGAGEAGREAILPLDRNTGWMDDLAQRIAPEPVVAGGGGGVSDATINITVDLDGDTIAESVIESLNQEMDETGEITLAI